MAEPPKPKPPFFLILLLLLLSYAISTFSLSATVPPSIVDTPLPSPAPATKPKPSSPPPAPETKPKPSAPSSSTLDPKQFTALESLSIPLGRDPCAFPSLDNATLCDSAKPFRHLLALRLVNCSDEVEMSATALKALATLKDLVFYNCPIEPVRFPSALASSLTSFTCVKSLRSLTGVWLSRLQNLTRLTVAGVTVNASGPAIILSNMKHLTSVTITSTNLTGFLPKKWHLNITSIDLSGNRLRGRMPIAITRLSDLQFLNLSSNQLAGELPTTLGDLISLRTLSLAGNSLSGRVPESLSAMPFLVHLDLSSNQFNGTVPRFISEMKHLKYLNLERNNFQGVMPFNASFIKRLAVFKGWVLEVNARVRSMEPYAIEPEKMAAAEARAAWQRTANRCFVQEDAKRAPKLACCSSSSSRSHSNGDAPCGPDHPVSNFVPLNWNTTQSNLPPDTKWWLQLQPNFTYQKDVGSEKILVSDAELKSMKDEPALPIPKYNVEAHVRLGNGEQAAWMPEAGVPPLKATNCKPQQPVNEKNGIGELRYLDEDLMDWEPIDLLLSDQTEKSFSAGETAWMGSEKVEPWWRTTDENELASLVAQKSLEHVENCDLPRPQKTNVSWGPFMGLESFHSDEIFRSSLDQKMYDGICNAVDYSELSTTKSMDQEHFSCHKVVHSAKDSERPNSVIMDSCKICTDKGPAKNVYATESDPSKSQLLEALRHSQTRAREAEKAAQQAYSEKEHIVKLFLRQASQLFACKQWLQLLQLETLYLQLKAKDHQISALFPVLPWMPPKSKLRKGASRKGRPHKCDIGRCAVAFAVGLSLAGAGLLLGWTLGWLFPSF
ncbi:hypothetical protein H6P81_014340 [Aristolochia fimbriata]|uniref:Uncharacterized protein n=1 Tax=Aristolochia fimbriata TaxID=158543 RepID=A0AAV7EKV5_ARIFI|nr:hypothetical protein H6P81_014340 [Aristolochia fimbriata]